MTKTGISLGKLSVTFMAKKVKLSSNNVFSDNTAIDGNQRQSLNERSDELSFKLITI